MSDSSPRQSQRRYGPAQMAAQAERAARLRESPEIRAALATIRMTPDVWGDVKVALSRRSEFVATASSDDERHRTFTPLLAAIALVPRAAHILDKAIDDAVDRETRQTWQRFRSGAGADELVVGTGPHAAIYNAERLSFEPDADVVTVDALPKIGGQFAQPEGPVWKLNSRNRPEDPDQANLPGGRGSLNTLGRSPLQQSDVSSMTYGDQNALGFVSKVNNYLAAHRLATRTELVSIEQDQADVGPPSLVATLRMTTSGETVSVPVKRIIGSTGLSTPTTGLDEDGDFTTRQILEAERSKPLEDRRVLLYEEFAELVGKKSNAFPLRGLKNIAVTGDGDGGRVAVGKLLGYETDNKMSVPNLDWVESVAWFGQASSTKEEFIECERVRYAELGLEFPRDETDYYSRVQPVKGKATFLREDLDSSGKPTGRVVVGGNGANAAVDLVVLAPGFLDRTNEIFGLASRETFQGRREVFSRVFPKDKMALGDSESIIKPGTVLQENSGRTIEIESVDKRRRSVTVLDTDPSGTTTRYTTDDYKLKAQLNIASTSGELAKISIRGDREFQRQLVYGAENVAKAETITDPDELKRQLPALLRTPGTELEWTGNISARVTAYDVDRNFTSLEFSYGDGRTSRVESLVNDDYVSAIEERIVSARVPMRQEPSVPIAVKDSRAEIYLIGPAARLPLTEAERNQSPALNQIPQNTAALFRYADKSRSLARLVSGPSSEIDASQQRYRTPYPVAASATPMKRAAQMRQSVSGVFSVSKQQGAVSPNGPIDVPAYGTKVDNQRSLGVSYADQLRYEVARWATTKDFAGITDLSLEVRRVSTPDGTNTSLEARLLNKRAQKDPLVREAIEQLLMDGDVQRSLSDVMDGSVLRPVAKIELPVINGVAQVSEMNVKATRDSSQSKQSNTGLRL